VAAVFADEKEGLTISSVRSVEISVIPYR